MRVRVIRAVGRDSGLVEVRVLSEPTTKSIAIQSPVRGRGGLSPHVSGKCLHRQSGAACIAPNAEKFDNQKPRAASFLFVRRGTQSYDEFIAAVPLLASPEHDARDDQHVRHFLDWRKRKCDHVRDKTNALQQARMTLRKTDNLLRGDRTPAYVDRETGAAELLISTDTWDQWVKEGRLPPPCDTFPSGTPRWRWEDVDRKLSGRKAADTDAAVLGAANFGKKKGIRRDAA